MANDGGKRSLRQKEAELAGQTGSFARAGATLLVVEDDNAIRKLVTKRLSAAGYNVEQAADAETGLKCIAEGSIDLVLLDIMLPGLSGYEALTTIRRKFPFSVLPVIMLSAKDIGEDVIRALNLGANDFTTKPVDWPLLLKRIELHLSLKTPADRTLGGYHIHRKIGEGAMGVVYEATQIASGRRAAVKVLPRALTVDRTFVDRFRLEAELAARVEHPNVVRFLEAGVIGDLYFMALEYIDGADLGVVRGEREMSVEEALRVARQTANGLKALDGAGILHRDIKPDNVMLTADGRAVITDLGVARDTAAQRRLTQTGLGVGSAGYAAPEQIAGGGDFRADIYSLGCTLYFMLVGEDPFKIDKKDWSAPKWRSPPKVEASNRRVSLQVSRLVLRMMAVNPKQRPASHEQLLTEIDRLLSDPDSLHRKHQPPYIWGGLVAGAALVAFLVFQLLTYG